MHHDRALRVRAIAMLALVLHLRRAARLSHRRAASVSISLSWGTCSPDGKLIHWRYGAAAQLAGVLHVVDNAGLLSEGRSGRAGHRDARGEAERARGDGTGLVRRYELHCKSAMRLQN